MEHTLATRYTVTRDPESEYPELAGLSGIIIVNDPTSDSEYKLCVWGNGASVEQELNSASSVTGYTEIGSIRADLEEIAEAITNDAYRAWISMNGTHDGSPRRTTMVMAKDICEEFVLNTIEVAQGIRDITQDVIADLVEA